MDEIRFGNKVHCSITGFSGLAMGRASYPDEPDQILIQPCQDEPTKKLLESQWITASRVCLDNEE